MAKTKTVIISYSWDSEAHKRWVRQLASRLVRNGVQVWLDQWHVQPGDSLTEFMEQKIAESDHVIVVCTPDYAKKSNTRRGGVGYEQQIISAGIATGIPRRKFIPVVRTGERRPGDNCAIPTHFGGVLAIDMRTPTACRSNFEALIRAVYNKPKHMPPALGRRRKLAKRAARARIAKRGAMRRAQPALRLARLAEDGWQLDSGVLRNELYPKTFWIPPEERRRSIKGGDFVKLPFEISVPDQDQFGPTAHERMWVKVEGEDAPYFVGKLMNQPVCSDVQKALKRGSQVVFLPENIIDIQTAEEAKAEELAEKRQKRMQTVVKARKKPKGRKKKV